MSEQLESDNINPYEDAVPKLSDGLLKHYKEPLEKVQEHLRELTTDQNKIIMQLHEENLALSEQFFSPDIQDLIKKMNLYHGKLMDIKKNMKNLHERSTRLKMLALKLEQYTEKMKIKKIQKELNMQKEQNLIGPGPSSSTESR